MYVETSILQSKKTFMNVVNIVNIGRNIHKFLISNVIYWNLLLNMITVGKVSKKIDFLENEVMPLLHGTLQLYPSPQIALVSVTFSRLIWIWNEHLEKNIY